MSILSVARRVVRKATLDVVRFHPRSHLLARRMRLLEVHGVDLVLDVGANLGQYGEQLRQLGYRGRIVSFEPLSSAFAQLRAHCAADAKWKAVQIGLGPARGRATINIAGNSASSSLLPMLDAHRQSAPESAYVGTEEIQIDTLAAGLSEHVQVGEHPFVKIDAQGYEKEILDGAGDAIERAIGMQLEMSLVSLYQGEMLLPQMLERMSALGFTLMSLEPGHSDPATGQLLQTDGLFFRSG